MKSALSLPNFDICADPRVVGRLAQLAEESGWHGFFLWDHVLWTWPEPMPACDPFMGLTAAALATSRIKLGALITPVPRRRPWNLARQIVTLDHLSGGRAVMGVGLGVDFFGDYSKFGEPADQHVQGEMLDEGLSVITGLWSGEPFTFQGKHYKISDAQLLPRPVQQPRVPVWVAATWPNKKPFRRGAKWDGIVPMLANEEREPNPAEVRDMIDYTLQFRESGSPLEVVLGGSTTGTNPQKDADHVGPLVEAGITWWLESFWAPLDVSAVSARIEQGPPQI